ncbi:MAG: NAD(P)-dependent oxidoreductase [Pseudomonadota bacterium]
MRHKIVVSQPIDPEVRAFLESQGDVVLNERGRPLEPVELRAACADADALMAFMTERIDGAFLSNCTRLKVVAGALKGYDNIDVPACSRQGVAVTIVPDLLTEPTAELTIGLMIALCRNMRAAEAHLRGGDFTGWRPRFYGRSLNGSTVGVLGAGRVGQAVLNALGGFRCERLYADEIALPGEQEAALGASRCDLVDLRRGADFLVLALPLTERTHGLVDRAFLSDMKPGAFLINPARGSLVDEPAVADALARGALAGYAADVFAMEDWAQPDRPREINENLRNSPKTVLTPHIGSAVGDVRRAIEWSAAESIATALRGEIPETAVNAAMLARSPIRSAVSGGAREASS